MVTKSGLFSLLILFLAIAPEATGKPHPHVQTKQGTDSSVIPETDLEIINPVSDTNRDDLEIINRFSDTNRDEAGCSVECCVHLLDTTSGERFLHGNGGFQIQQGIWDDDDASLSPCIPEEEEEFDKVIESQPVAIKLFLIIILVLGSGLFSGLTLGLMGLDKTGLECVMGGDDPKLAKAASRIYPFRINGNSLLCTLLLGNVGVNSLLSIVMADLTSGMVGFISSTFIIVVFGEVLPQAACSRYALEIGSRSIPIVRIFSILLCPFTAPLSFLLNVILGSEEGTMYTKAELQKLFEIHVSSGKVNQEAGITLKGALVYMDMTVQDVMTPLSKTFMLSADEKLTPELIAVISETGFSRIPVYEDTLNNIVGKIFVKDLISIKAQGMFIKDIVNKFGRGLFVVSPEDNLGDVLREFKKGSGRSHMAVVRDGYITKGIITLEDIIEVILGDQIFDETDRIECDASGTSDETLSVQETSTEGRLFHNETTREESSRDHLPFVCIIEEY